MRTVAEQESLVGARRAQQPMHHQQGGRPSVRSMLCTVLGVTLLVSWGVQLWSDDGGVPTVPMRLVREGATAHAVDDRGVILVRDATGVHGLLAATSSGEPVQLCAAAGVLVQVPSRSVFGLDGLLISGPSPQHLSQVEVVGARDGVVEVHFDVVRRRPIDGVDLPRAARLDVGTWIDRFDQPSWCPGDGQLP